MFRHLIVLSVLAVLLAVPSASALSLGGRGAAVACGLAPQQPSGDPSVALWQSPCRTLPSGEGPSTQSYDPRQNADRRAVGPSADASLALPRLIVVPWIEPQPLPAPLRTMPCRPIPDVDCAALDGSAGGGVACAMVYPWSRLCGLPGGFVIYRLIG